MSGIFNAVFFKLRRDVWLDAGGHEQSLAGRERLLESALNEVVRYSDLGDIALLQQLLDLRGSIKLSTVAAAVIAGGASPEFRTITIDKGTGDGIAPDMAVISPAGVVGRIVLPTPRAAKVQLLIDRDAAAGGLVERTRAQGVLVGTGTDRVRLDHVPGTADIRIGDRVVTSGIEGIYPKGFAIGQIESFERRAGEFTAVMIRPAVEFSNLEVVLVVVTPRQAEVGAHLMGALRSRLSAFDVIGDIRGLGLMIGVEVVKDRARREPAPEIRERILEEAFRRGLLLLGCGKNTIRISPPLVIDREDAEIAARILAEAVAAATGR